MSFLVDHPYSSRPKIPPRKCYVSLNRVNQPNLDVLLGLDLEGWLHPKINIEWAHKHGSWTWMWNALHTGSTMMAQSWTCFI